MPAHPMLRAMAAALVATVASTSATAESWTTSAYSIRGASDTERQALPDGRAVVTVSSRGTFVTDDPAIPLNESRYRCHGSFVVTVVGEETSGNGICTGVDPRGDVWWVHWTGAIDGGSWTFIGGTGRYRGVSGGGEWLQADAGAGREVAAWEGTIEVP